MSDHLDRSARGRGFRGLIDLPLATTADLSKCKASSIRIARKLPGGSEFRELFDSFVSGWNNTICEIRHN